MSIPSNDSDGMALWCKARELLVHNLICVYICKACHSFDYIGFATSKLSVRFECVRCRVYHWKFNSFNIPVFCTACTVQPFLSDALDSLFSLLLSLCLSVFSNKFELCIYTGFSNKSWATIKLRKLYYKRVHRSTSILHSVQILSKENECF